jgi:hypothetical protein
LAIAVATIAAISGDASRRSVRTSGTGSSTWRRAVAIALSAANGGRPVTSSNSTAPTE